jgi:hypothetical protein
VEIQSVAPGLGVMWVVTHTLSRGEPESIVGIFATELGALHYCHLRGHHILAESSQELQFGTVESPGVLKSERPNPVPWNQSCRVVQAAGQCWTVHETLVQSIPRLSKWYAKSS